MPHDTDEAQHKSVSIDKWKKGICKASNIAVKRSSSGKEQHKKRSQRKIPSHTILQPGDKLLLVRALSRTGRTGTMALILGRRDSQSNSEYGRFACHLRNSAGT